MTDHSTGEHLNTALFYGVVILLAYLVYRVFAPFLVPLGWAGVLVVVFYPLHMRLERRWGKTRAAAASTAGVTLILIVPALLLMTLFVREGFVAARGIQQAISAGQLPAFERAWQWVQGHFEIAQSGGGSANLSGLVQRYAEQVAGFVASQVGTVLRNAALFLFELFVTLFALFYFFRDAETIMSGVRVLLPFEKGRRERMLTQTRVLIHASVTTSLVIAAVQGLVCGIGFAVVGLSAALFWGVVMAFSSLLPVVGSALIWVPASIWLVLTGHAWRAILLLAICGGFTSVIDSFLRPIMLSGHARLNGLLVFISAFGGIVVFGMLGLVLGPIVVATAASLLESHGASESSG